MIHSAGNSGENIDVTESFPTDKYLDGGEATNWISVGASQMIINKEFAADFSNYGAKQVDIFAPGVDIISTDSCNMYNMHSGTSFSGPVVTGVAALVLSYFPKITPQQMVELLMKSSSKVTKPKSILEPSLTAEKRAKTSFSSLSKSGGIVNAYNALLLAQQKYGK
jgi:subtilisin family serine protease